MSALEQWKLIYLSHFSHPACDRPVFKAIRKNRVRSIVECGVGTTQRSQRMIEAARLLSPDAEIHFTGIDLFEARCAADGPGVSLKLAHRRLSATGARVKLVPGDPLSALARTANTLGNTDLLIISARQGRAAMSAAWFFVPRILHAGSVVFEEVALGGGKTLLKTVAPEEVARRAGVVDGAARSRRAA